MKLDMNRMLIETAIRRALQGMETSPERSIRNLIDLGLNFSQGELQQKLLHTAKDMLRDQNSAYYTLLKDTLVHVDMEKLITLGMALGYNSCTKGAAAIRQLEAQQGFNIPWLLSMAVNCASLPDRTDDYAQILAQGTELGIYTYAFFPDGDPAPLLPHLRAQRSCAFFLLLPSGQLTEKLTEELKQLDNVLTAVQADQDAPAACARLRAEKLPFAVWRRYGQADQADILSGRWLEDLLPGHPLFALLLPEVGCPAKTRSAVCAYLHTLRVAQKTPVIPMELLQDGLMIDEIISDNGCLVGFDQAGELYTHDGPCPHSGVNLFRTPLEDILRRVQAMRETKP